MAKYRYVGKHSGAVSAVLKESGGREKLRGWRDRAAERPGSSRVWLVDQESCDVILNLFDAEIDAQEFWAGDVFAMPADRLAVEVEAESPEKCYEVLVKHLFSRFSGQHETGQAHFPLAVISSEDAPTFSAISEMSENGKRVCVRQIQKWFYVAAVTLSGPHGAVEIEYLTVSVPADKGGAEFWVPAA